MFKAKLIKTENDLLEATQRFEMLLSREELSPEDDNELELLAHLIDEYETQAYPIALPSPISALRFRMEQMGMNQTDLIPYIGSRSKVSDILNGKRQLTLKMIRSLHAGLSIPIEALVSVEQESFINESSDIDWDKFPIRDMYNTGKEFYFPNIKASLQQIKENVEYYVRSLIEPIRKFEFNGGLLRQNVRMGCTTDKYALMAWLAACYNLANQETLKTSFDPSKMEIIINQLRSLSVMDDGPLQAGRFLSKVGIHLVVVPHLPKTHLDGASFIARDDNPTVALTLRYDRIDHFWFTLFHELGHVYFHLNSNPESNCFIDDLRVIASGDMEEQADKYASESLISDDELRECELFSNYSKAAVEEFAFKKRVHPAIIAGRIRHHLDNFYILSNLVGNGQVRKLFYAQ